MKVFTVHTPPDVTGDAAAEAARFVKDGFSWPALFVPLLWLIWHRMWVVLVLYLVAAGLIGALAMPAGDLVAGLVGVVFALWFGFEANNLRRWSLDRRDWSEIGMSHGRRRAEAEIRFFATRADREAAAVSRPPASHLPASTPAHPPAAAYPGMAQARPDPGREPVFGLFPETDR